MTSSLVSHLPSPLSHFHKRIVECSDDASNGPVVIVALGDSVTAGAGPEGPDGRDYVDEVYHARLKVMLQERYPQCEFQIVNSGIGGEAASAGLATFDERVVIHHPDLLLIGYGLNDAGERGLEGLPKYKQSIELLIERARETTTADIMLLSSNMMPIYESEKIPEHWRHVTDRFIQIQTTGVLAAYANCLMEIAQADEVAVADVYAEWERMAAQGVDTTQMLVNGLNHPDETGHMWAAQVIMRVIENSA